MATKAQVYASSRLHGRLIKIRNLFIKKRYIKFCWADIPRMKKLLMTYEECAVKNRELSDVETKISI